MGSPPALDQVTNATESLTTLGVVPKDAIEAAEGAEHDPGAACVVCGALDDEAGHLVISSFAKGE